MMDTKQVALSMYRNKTVSDCFVRAEAEKMMGCKFEDMTKEQRVLSAQCISALGLYYYQDCIK